MRIIILMLLPVALTLGCSPKSAYLKDNYDNADAYMAQITVRSVSVVDERTGVSDKPLDPQFFAVSGSSRSVNPPLTDEYKKLLSDEILKYTGKFGREYDVTVQVKKAEKAVRSAWPEKFESVNVTLVIRFSAGDIVKTYSGDASLEVKSLKATDEYLEEMFRKVLRDCVHQCFVSLKAKQEQGAAR